MPSRSLCPSRRAGAIAASLLLLGLTGCSGDDPVDAADAPTDATPHEFCAAYDAVVAEADEHERSERLADVGTPDDIPEQARAGYVVFVAAASVSDGDAGSELAGAGSAQEAAAALDLAGDDARDYGAFDDYVRGTCFAGDQTTDGD